MPILVQIDARVRATGAAVTLRACSHDEPAVCHALGETWWPVLSKLPKLRYDFFDGDFSADITSPTSALSFHTGAWPEFGSYALADARIRIRRGSGDAWAIIFDGRVTAEPKVRGLDADLSVAVDDRWLDKPLLRTFAGSTGAEGPAALRGQIKPLALGAPRYVPGVLVDPVANTFMVSDGPIEAVEAALERLARLDGPHADYPTLAALNAATIPNGWFATSLAAGYARLGAPPTGQMSFMVRGHAAGGFVRRPGAIIRRVAEIAGRGDRVDTALLAALDAARPYDVSVYVGEQTTPRQLIQRLAASVNAVAGVSWTGALFALPVAIGTPSVTLSVAGAALPPVRSCEHLELAPPFAKVGITAERTWQVHALGDVAFTAPLIERGLYDPAESYREGHIVALDDGSRWLYVGAEPAVGAPPAANDPRWSLLQAAPVATYADGTTIDELRPAGPGATKGAPAGTEIGGRPVEQVLDALDYQALAADNADVAIEKAVADGVVQPYEAQSVLRKYRAMGEETATLANGAYRLARDPAALNAAYRAIAALFEVPDFGVRDVPVSAAEWARLRDRWTAERDALRAAIGNVGAGLGAVPAGDFIGAGVTLSGGAATGRGTLRTAKAYASPQVSARLTKGRVKAELIDATNGERYGLAFNRDGSVDLITASAPLVPYDNAKRAAVDIRLNLFDDGRTVNLMRDVAQSDTANGSVAGLPANRAWIVEFTLLDADSAIEAVTLQATRPVDYLTSVVNGPPADATHGANVTPVTYTTSGAIAAPDADGFYVAGTGAGRALIVYGLDGPVPWGGEPFLNVALNATGTAAGPATFTILWYGPGSIPDVVTIDARATPKTVAVPFGTTRWQVTLDTNLTSGQLRFKRPVLTPTAAAAAGVEIVRARVDDGIDGVSSVVAYKDGQIVPGGPGGTVQPVDDPSRVQLYPGWIAAIRAFNVYTPERGEEPLYGARYIAVSYPGRDTINSGDGTLRFVVVAGGQQLGSWPIGFGQPAFSAILDVPAGASTYKIDVVGNVRVGPVVATIPTIRLRQVRSVDNGAVLADYAPDPSSPGDAPPGYYTDLRFETDPGQFKSHVEEIKQANLVGIDARAPNAVQVTVSTDIQRTATGGIARITQTAAYEAHRYTRYWQPDLPIVAGGWVDQDIGNGATYARSGWARSANAATDGATIGGNLLLPGGQVAKSADVVTSQGIAAGFAGEAPTARSSDFAVLTGATKPADNAGSNFTLVQAGLAPHAQRGNAIYRADVGQYDFGGGMLSLEHIVGTAIASGRLPDASTQFGLADNATFDAGDTLRTLAAGWHYSANGNWYIFIQGAEAFFGTAGGGVNFTPSTLFTVTYDGAAFRFYANGSLILDRATARNRRFRLAASAGISGTTVTDLQFGAYTDNTWGSTVGDGRPEDYSTRGAELGFNLRYVNGEVIPRRDLVTSEGIAAGFAGEAPTARSSDFSVITGPTRPEPNADVTVSALPFSFETEPVGLQTAPTTSRPMALHFPRYRGLRNVSREASWSLSNTAGLTASIVNDPASQDRGLIRVSEMRAMTGFLRIVSAQGGTDFVTLARLEKQPNAGQLNPSAGRDMVTYPSGSASEWTVALVWELAEVALQFTVHHIAEASVDNSVGIAAKIQHSPGGVWEDLQDLGILVSAASRYNNGSVLTLSTANYSNARLAPQTQQGKRLLVRPTSNTSQLVCRAAFKQATGVEL